MNAADTGAAAGQGSLRRAGYRRSAGSPRGEARRRELLDRVADDLAVNGLVDFSLRRAARAAGTTHKVLLYHFDGADDLLTQAILQLRERRIDNALAVSAARAGPHHHGGPGARGVAGPGGRGVASARPGHRADDVRPRPLRRARPRGVPAVPALAAVPLP